MGIYAGYARLSRDEDGQKYDSIEQQKSIITNYYRNVLNYEGEISFFIDDNYSGMNFNRPGFQELREEVLKNNVVTVAFKDLSRFGRDGVETQRYWKEFVNKYGVVLIGVSQNQDSRDRHTRKTLGLYTWLNEQYVEDISEKIKENFQQRQEKGDLIITVPYGYIKEGKKIIVDDYASDIVREIFDLYLGGNGFRKIASIIDGRGYLTPSNYKNRADAQTVWSFQVVKNILTNDFYMGTLTQKKTFKREIKGKSFRNPKENVLKFPDHHEPIISKENFELVQRVMKERDQRKIKGSKGDTPHIFAGKIFCAKCGKTYVYRAKRNGGMGYYLCGTQNKLGVKYCRNNTIAENKLVKIILTQLRQKIQENLDLLDELKAKINRQEEQTRLDTIIERLKIEIEKRERNIQKVYVDKLNNVNKIPESILDNTLRQLSEELEKFKQQLESTVNLKNSSNNQQEILESQNEKLSRFINKDYLTRKDIEILIDKINMDDTVEEPIAIYWNV